MTTPQIVESKLSIQLVQKRNDRFIDFFIECPDLGIVAHGYKQETAWVNFHNMCRKLHVELAARAARGEISVVEGIRLETLKSWLGVA